jgi:hypothetical protein
MVRTIPAILAEQQLDQLLHPLIGKRFRKGKLLLLNLEEDVIRIFLVTCKGKVPHCQLVNDDS